MFYQEIREMLLEINEDAVKCRAHSIMEKTIRNGLDSVRDFFVRG